MRIKNITEEEKERIFKAYKTARNTNEKIRCQALKLLAEGYKRKEVSAITGFGKQTVGLWVTAYNKHGIEGLREKRTTGNHKKLTGKQKNNLAKILKAETPDTRGYQGKFWTVNFLKQLIKQEYGIAYKNNQSYRNIFSYAGFSFHKPEKVNKNRNPHMRQRFEEKIKKNSKNTGEKMVWYW